MTHPLCLRLRHLVTGIDQDDHSDHKDQKNHHAQLDQHDHHSYHNVYLQTKSLKLNKKYIHISFLTVNLKQIVIIAFAITNLFFSLRSYEKKRLTRHLLIFYFHSLEKIFFGMTFQRKNESYRGRRAVMKSHLLQVTSDF